MDLFDPDVLKVVLPYLIFTGAIGVVVAGLIVWQLTKVQGQQNATQKMLIDFMQKDLSNIRNDFVADGARQNLELQEQTKVLNAMREDRRGDLALSVKLVEAVQGTGEDMTSALSAYTRTTMDALEAGRKRMIDAVKESTTKQDLKEAVQVSVDNQNANHTIVMQQLGPLAATTNSIDEKVTAIGLNVHEIPQWQQAVNDIVRTVNKIELMIGKQDETNALLTSIRDGMKEIKADVAKLQGPPAPSFDAVAVSDAIVKRKTTPIPDMPTTGPLPDAVNTVFDATPVIPLSQLGDTGGQHASAED